MHLVEMVMEMSLTADCKHFPAEDLFNDIGHAKVVTASRFGWVTTIRVRRFHRIVVGDEGRRLKQRNSAWASVRAVP
jgi:hypothetical protein